MGRVAQRFAFACALTSARPPRSSSQHPTPPRAALYGLRSAWGIGVRLCPLRLLLNRLGRFSRSSGSVQFLAELVALAFGRFAPPLLLRHPLAQRRLRHFAAGTFGVELFAELSQLAGRRGALRGLSHL